MNLYCPYKGMNLVQIRQINKMICCRCVIITQAQISLVDQTLNCMMNLKKTLMIWIKMEIISLTKKNLENICLPQVVIIQKMMKVSKFFVQCSEMLQEIHKTDSTKMNSQLLQITMLEIFHIPLKMIKQIPGIQCGTILIFYGGALKYLKKM